MKNKNQYYCTECDASYPRWSGKCNQCGNWNCIQEITEAEQKLTSGSASPLLQLSEIDTSSETRFSTGIKDFDQVLGGGIVPESILLLAGEPGVGKSTLMLELARHTNVKTYYFSAEETVKQLARRAKRMGIEEKKLFISRENNIKNICHTILKDKVPLAIVDSIQTIFHPDRERTVGGVGQLRDVTMLLLDVARQSETSIFITGHVTKDGNIAGPRLLEHMVDTVLYFESDRTNHYRMVRAVKNRFGAIGEVAVFEMLSHGLKVVKVLPLFLNRENISGTVHSLMLGGSRPIPVEIQALVTKASGPPKRMTEGLDNRRFILLGAVLEKYLGEAHIAECDLFANLAGGFSSDEPALDLAQCLAILSSSLEKIVHPKLACLGEVGLSGEVRPIGQLAFRIKELENLGL